MPLKIARKNLNKDFIKAVRGGGGHRFMKLFHKIPLFSGDGFPYFAYFKTPRSNVGRGKNFDPGVKRVGRRIEEQIHCERVEIRSGLFHLKLFLKLKQRQNPTKNLSKDHVVDCA